MVAAGTGAAVETEFEVGTEAENWADKSDWHVEDHGSWQVESITDPISVASTHIEKLRLHYSVCDLEG